MPTTQHLLDVLRDARDEGLWQEQLAVVKELELDAEYLCHTYHQSVTRTTQGRYRRVIERGEWLVPASMSRRMVDLRFMRHTSDEALERVTRMQVIYDPVAPDPDFAPPAFRAAWGER